ncbi:MAG: threonine synthase [Terrisporobacter sp.]|uniref:threonine synthase n=1 Tax=Terrisporobacter sp. TaxID=1965305 RepID=UPI002FC73175
MHFTSTRGNNDKLTPSKAIIKGLSQDGGLYVPSDFPNVKQELNSLVNLTYKELAFFILEKYLIDFTEEELKDCINKAYDSKFDTKSITPIRKINKDYFLELYHGPTCAFKDIALTIMPHLMTNSMKKNNINKEVVILTATSGDTGKAALEGYKNIDNTKIIVFFPQNGVSSVQKLQMTSQEGNNTFVVSINGNFDDAQSGVKEVFNDKEFIEDLSNRGYLLSSANSINIGRLLPQIVYYFFSYFELVRQEEIDLFHKINFVVPSGNFGDILAGYYAKRMGLPINKLICASNENNVLYEFFSNGIYNKNRDLKLTSSPSMDILVSSNLERLLYEICNRDCDKVNELINNLNNDGMYKINNYMKENLKDFHSEYVTEDEVKNTIYKVYKNYNYLIDTHTAVAYSSLEKYKKESQDTTKSIILSTASPYKFGKDVLNSLGIIDSSNDDFSSLDKLSHITKTPIPLSILKLKNATILHKRNCKKYEIMKEVKIILKD